LDDDALADLIRTDRIDILVDLVGHMRGHRSSCLCSQAGACALGCEGIVSKRLGSLYRSGRSQHWLKVKNPKAPAVKREAEEDWGNKRRSRWR
jgi:ATP-dependent DNA ligase